MADGPRKPTTPTKLGVISMTVSLAVTTVVLLGVYVTSYLATTGAGSIFKNTTTEVSDAFPTQVSGHVATCLVVPIKFHQT